ncbi:BTB/POZ domain-containing protein KCTD11 [Rhinatrema bivittatum]|uniref:BTB/POZ domain-containing protein KCTD11 n=1 Tax=Rhinatrema bivittatum TaxID=194408 RepID=UPI0011279238|nr:BTB/POZ domain-containing protein KCTD11 [Rhinatrema bivittatum]
MLNFDPKTGAPVFGGPVALNVGGKLYSTTLETLTKYPDSMLGAMFNGLRPPARADGGGRFFIDRDGKTFRHVLNFLRLGRLDLPEGYRELALLRREADFYQIRPLLEEIRQREEEARCQRERNAILHADVDRQGRLLHFTLKKGPQSYDLCTCHIQIYTANLFCTDASFLRLLRARLACGTPGSEEEEEEDADDQEENGGEDHHLRLEWAPQPPDLPQVEYRKHRFQRLRVVPEGQELTSAGAFLEEVLKTALRQGFRIESIFPDPEDILNSRSLRFVRH